MSQPVIDISGLNYWIGKRQILHDIQLTVPSGSIFGFLGHNGAGKTTTIRQVLGLSKVQEGSIRVFGHSMPQERIAVLRRVGSMVEEPALYRHLTGRENLEVIRRMHGADKSRVGHVLSIVELTRDANRPVKQYSQGMRQRLGIAMALLPNPDLLILDEPTNGLDPAGIRDMRELLQHLNREHGKTILVSSHLLAEVERTVTHLGIIDHGRMRFQGTIENLQALTQKRRLRVSLSDVALGEAALLAAGYAVELQGQQLGQLVVAIETPEAAAPVVRTLVNAGVDIYALEPNASLEELFFSLTATAVHPQPATV